MDTVRTDVVVVGAGAAGLLAAMAARRLGHDVLVVEASPLVGGATAIGDGRIWLPANHLMEKLGVGDSTVEAAEYLDGVLGPPSDTSTPERRAAYVETAPKLARWLASSRLPLLADRESADDLPQLPGAKPSGRVLRSQAFDRRVLGEWTNALRSAANPDDRPMSERVLGRFGPRHASRGSGEALAAELLHRAVGNGVELWLDSPVTELLADSGGVGGVVVRRVAQGSGVAAGVQVEARVGVILAGGGFEADQAMREENLPLPTDAAWTASGVGNDGSAIALAMAHGAATAGMDEAWWTPVILVDGVAHPLDEERSRPHGMIVDATGSRFLDEAAPAVQVGRQLYDRSHGVRAIPSYLVVDNRFRREYGLGPWPPGSNPRPALESGDLVKASTLNELAQKLEIDRAGLLGTAVRFNGFARKGRDLDFERGEGLTPAGGRRRNPSLGKVDKPPFWAVRVYPGDLGTKGGLLVDADARVLRADGTAIPRLYACAGTAASMMGRTSPGPGAALGEALIGAFRAAVGLAEDEPAD